MKEKKINLVLFNISVEGGFSGVNRYLEMISRSMAGVEGDRGAYGLLYRKENDVVSPD